MTRSRTAVALAAIILVGALLLPGLCFSQTPFANGNTYFQRGEYPQAQQQYLAQLQRGPVTAPLLYNLGNTCLRLQQLGWAILYYERALLATPRDADLRANLALAIASRQAPPSTEAPGWTQVVLRGILDRFSLNELAGAASLMYFAACAMLLWRLRSRNFRRRYMWILGIVSLLAVLLIFLGATKAHLDHNPRRAVVVTSGNLMSGPGDSFQAVRKVYEGEMAQITGRQGVWREVRLETGTVGWLSQGAVETVVAPQAGGVAGH
ncbi:MAG: SH3 domain-containing protein [Armatimonadia bacterium]